MQYILSFITGILTVLTPCILPLTPIVIKGTISKKKYTSLILTSGLVVIFTIFGLFFDLLKSYFENDLIKNTAGIVLILSGLVILFPKIKEFFHKHKKHNCSCHQINTEQPMAQFLMGFILGAVWLPCSLHTLGIVIGLASTNGNYKPSFLMFTFFAIGVSIPLIILSKITKGFIMQYEKKIAKIGNIGNKILAYTIIILGILILMNFYTHH